MFLPFRDHNPSRRRAYVTWSLIVINCVAYLSTSIAFGDSFSLSLLHAEWALVPKQIMSGQNWNGLLTSMFLHGGLLHLSGNMLYLAIFGDNLEDRLGHIPFLLFYLACGVAAGLVHVSSSPFSTIPLVGASGAIAGVMGGYLLLFPRARIDVFCIFLIFFKIVSVSAWIVIGVWFAIQLFGASGPAGTVAYWAHLGGFLAGAVLTLPVFFSSGGVSRWGSRTRLRQTDGIPPVSTTFPLVTRRRR